MADLTFGDVLLIGGIAALGFALLAYWWSGVMVRRDWSWQVRKAKPKSGRTTGKKDRSG